MRAAYGPKQATVVVGVCGVAGASCDEGPEGTASIAAAEVDHGQKPLEHVHFPLENVEVLSEHVGFPMKSVAFLNRHVDFPMENLHYPVC